MFEDWKRNINRYLQKHIDRRLLAGIASELDSDIVELSDLYTSVLLENGVIDRNGNDTSVDFDEDDLLESMLDRFLALHADTDDDRALLYATLVDQYLALEEEASEDI